MRNGGNDFHFATSGLFAVFINRLFGGEVNDKINGRLLEQPPDGSGLRGVNNGGGGRCSPRPEIPKPCDDSIVSSSVPIPTKNPCGAKSHEPLLFLFFQNQLILFSLSGCLA